MIACDIQSAVFVILLCSCCCKRKVAGITDYAGIRAPLGGTEALRSLDNSANNISAFWKASGCTQALPDTSAQALDTSFVADLASSHDPAKQKICYGFSAGDQAQLDPVKLFRDPSAEKLSCDAAKGQKLREDFNITADPTKQAAKKKLFQTVVTAFHKMEVPIVMTAGLILGWWRECDFLAHDSDMDMAVLHRHMPSDFEERLKREGFSVDIRVAPEASFVQVHDNVGLEVTLKHKDAPGTWCDIFVWEELPVAASDPSATSSLEVYQSLWYNNNHGHFWGCKQKFQSLAQIRWNDVDVYIPYPPEMHLETKYGADWGVPKATNWCVYCDCDKAPNHVHGRAPWQKQWSLS